MRILLTMIRLIFKVLFLPVRGVLHILAFILKILLSLGSVVAWIFAIFCYILVALSLLNGDPFSSMRTLTATRCKRAFGRWRPATANWIRSSSGSTRTMYPAS